MDVSVKLGKWGGVGAVIRDFDRFYPSCSKLGHFAQYGDNEAKASAYHMGLKLVMECCFMEIVLESDNVEVIHALSFTINKTIILAL